MVNVQMVACFLGVSIRLFVFGIEHVHVGEAI